MCFLTAITPAPDSMILPLRRNFGKEKLDEFPFCLESAFADCIHRIFEIIQTPPRQKKRRAFPFALEKLGVRFFSQRMETDGLRFRVFFCILQRRFYYIRCDIVDVEFKIRRINRDFCGCFVSSVGVGDCYRLFL